MLCRVVFHTRTMPVPEYTMACHGCTFSGSGYTNERSCTVPYGTKITIFPGGNSGLGYWSGSYSAGACHDGVAARPITWMVKNNYSFTAHGDQLT